MFWCHAEEEGRECEFVKSTVFARVHLDKSGLSRIFQTTVYKLNPYVC